MNPRVSSLNQSSTLRITALTKKLRQEGKDIVNFAAGEPDFDTPAFIKDAAGQALKEGFTKYTPSAGIPALRQAIAKKLKEENNILCEDKNIIVTTGAKYAVFAAIFSLIQEGDEVLIPGPYWVSYPEIVTLAGGVSKIIACPEDTFKIKPEDLEKAITSKTKILILNYPANPTGATYTPEELEHIYDVVQDKNIFVLSDEIYEKIIFDGRRHVSFASLGDARNFTVTVNGFSKSYSMTGWRIGYLAAPPEVIELVEKVIDHTTSCACAVSQKAALAALADKSWPQTIKKDFQERRDVLWQGLSVCPKLAPVKPAGTFYMLCDIRKTGLSSLEFSSQLLEKHLVSCIPALAFGAEGFVRLSFATSCVAINKGIERIKKFVSEL